MPSIELRTRQSLALTPRMQQSVRLLQLSSIEFQQALRQALDTNPFLEYDQAASEDVALATSSNHDDGAAAHDAGAADGAGAASGAADDGGARDDAPADFPADLAGETFGRSTSRAQGDGEDSDPADWVRIQPSLREQLHDALRLCQLDARDREAAQVVIEAIDDDGYLRQELAELAAIVEIEPSLDEEELRVALRFVQTLDRPGIGARSLAECLVLQLDALPADVPGRDLARQVAGHHLERLARREHAELQRQLGCTPEALRVACALVRRLDPKPGNAYGRADGSYVVPDVIVRAVRNRFSVSINPAVQPRARINRLYARLFAQAGGSSRSPLSQQLQEARWLIRNVQQRFDTIQRVAECIVAHQKAFFQYGEIALKPMVLRDVAEELGLHESTISRATGNKYMATPRGIFEFKHFFPRELGTDSGGTCSSAAVRALLKEMIAAEDVRDPHSDVTLARMLAEQGVLVARRTVAKYRNLMKVPPAELRRQL
jgi:RNA polymerase sigma-54 factor